ncbi:MAG: ABC transporter permease [Planctomycetota bacterium]
MTVTKSGAADTDQGRQSAPIEVSIPVERPGARAHAEWGEQEVVIDQARGRLSFAMREAMAARELLALMVARDVSVRYRQAALGVAWALFVPLIRLAVFSLFFGFLGRMGPNDMPQLPYAVFLFSGMVIWDYFNSSLGRAANSLEASQGLLSKVYFPRLLLPLASVISPLVELGFMFLVMVGVLAWHHEVVTPNWALLSLLPLYALMAVGAALGFGLWLAGFNAHYRDVRQALPVMINMAFFATPVLYPIELVREKFPAWAVHLYELNPMVTVVMGFRAGLLGMDPPGLVTVLSGVGVVVFALATGLLVFNRMEKTVADVL